jgi:glycosyltransferase involved in cell wall biosynthesis
MKRVLHLVSAGGSAMRRTVAEHVRAFGGDTEQRMLAPDAEAKILRPLGVPIESWRPAGLFNVLRSIGALRRSVERYEPEAIIAYGWTAGAVGLGSLAPRFARRILVRLQDPIRDGEMPKAFYEKRLPELMQRAGAISCAYRTLAHQVTGTLGVAPERVTIAPYPIPSEIVATFERTPNRHGPVIGLVQRLEAEGAWGTAIDALAELKTTHPDARLWLAGDGPILSIVRAYARQRGVIDEISFFGDMPGSALLSGVDLVLVPASRDALPYTLLEALVAGVPVIAGNTAAMADLLADFETAWLVPDDGRGFAHGIATVWPAIDAAWTAAQAQRAKAAAAFDPATVMGAMRALCDRLAEAPEAHERGEFADATLNDRQHEASA